MSIRFKDHIITPGLLAARPAANTAPAGALYPATDTLIVYRSDGTAWSTWADLNGSMTAETVRDTIAAALVNGAGISIVVDDTGDTITISNTGATTRAINAQTGTAYTLVLGDAGKFVTMTNTGASTLTVPANSAVAFPTGTVIEGAQMGAGQVTLTPDAGVTINATPGLKIAAQYGTFGLLKTGADTWLATGRLSA